ncbi:hypothetical protein KIN20_003445 [Parelaphostrongylus tenuis]|uniref:Uncharacterized protein n=1 Tax=Parelaphostrongylus tenuis TaxID=148309 RepID=A0AAD5LWS0_PARTN|nr:hypothetical protein KIN20_003445 [Parelaphostrongylus tenuis]
MDVRSLYCNVVHPAYTKIIKYVEPPHQSVVLRLRSLYWISAEEWKLKILTNTAKLPANPLMISLLAMISTALGCGVMPPGQDDEKKTLYHIADMTNRRWKLINTDQIRYI